MAYKVIVAQIAELTSQVLLRTNILGASTKIEMEVREHFIRIDFENPDGKSSETVEIDHAGYAEEKHIDFAD